MGRLTDKENYCIKTGCSACAGGVGIGCYEEKIYNKLKEYEHLEEQGLLLKLPCNVGTIVYLVTDRCKTVCSPYDCDNNCKECTEHVYEIWEVEFDYGVMRDLGKTVFLNKAEAEKALAEMEK